ncbi:hypothetical protein KUV28_12125 [Ferrimonas balearica]|nr:hypothetical protein [Ferrimonas balearica]
MAGPGAEGQRGIARLAREGDQQIDGADRQDDPVGTAFGMAAMGAGALAEPGRGLAVDHRHAVAVGADRTQRAGARLRGEEGAVEIIPGLLAADAGAAQIEEPQRLGAGEGDLGGAAPPVGRHVLEGQGEVPGRQGEPECHLDLAIAEAQVTEDIAQLAPSLAEDRRKVRWINDYVDARIAQRGGARRTAQELHEAIQACVAEDRKGLFRKPAG